MTSGWIGVDLDGTLAEYHGWNNGKIGKPVEPMVRRVKLWLERGVEVRIMTARALVPTMVPEVQDWLQSVGLPRLAVTNAKDFAMFCLWDDRCVRVEANTGKIMSGEDESGLTIILWPSGSFICRARTRSWTSG